MIDTEQLLNEIYPNFKLLSGNKLVLGALKRVLHEADCNNVIRKSQHLNGYAFLDKLLDDLNFSYKISAGSQDSIPSVGRLLIVANHPIGTLDGLALVQLVRTIRPDVRIVANRLLLNVEPLQSVFLPVEVLSDKKNLKDSYKTMLGALKNEEALIIFPAGEVSRITPAGIRDGEWQTGFIKLAKKNRCNILPIHITAKNSILFYAMSMLYKRLATMLLFKEMFNKNNQTIEFKIGCPIPYTTIAASADTHKQLSQRVRQHVLSLGKKKLPLLFD
ncbi:MAG: lysophospholipid acyltransferase family protein [Methylovulum sp.]|nr:lysophospholipid acyltransferase family protein [Methylovulum sp.]